MITCTKNAPSLFFQSNFHVHIEKKSYQTNLNNLNDLHEALKKELRGKVHLLESPINSTKKKKKPN